jgi:hypothetical protein
MVRHAFVTVTDQAFFPGTLATVNSIFEFDSDADIYVIVDERKPLTPPQRECFRGQRGVRLMESSQFDAPGRVLKPWELKAYACHDLCADFEVIICIDSDCLLCSEVGDVIHRCLSTQGFLGGRDGDGVCYDESYAPYGMAVPAHNPRYMSTSLMFCAVNDKNRRALRRWAECCNSAQFNGSGPHPGHGDQGVLNAVLFADGRSDEIELLDNRLWSQHWCYWDSIIDFRDGAFFNMTADGARQRSFHCGGAEKFWLRAHRDRVLNGNALQTYSYVWFLTMLWFGACRDWSVDPYQYLPPESHHLADDLAHFFPQIAQVYPRARSYWNHLSDPFTNRMLEGIPRALSLGGACSRSS